MFGLCREARSCRAALELKYRVCDLASRRIANFDEAVCSSLKPSGRMPEKTHLQDDAFDEIDSLLPEDAAG